MRANGLNRKVIQLFADVHNISDEGFNKLEFDDNNVGEADTHYNGIYLHFGRQEEFARSYSAFSLAFMKVGEFPIGYLSWSTIIFQFSM
ncbi:hypothetical protein SUGI_0831870 [Cryptomeria japonica]|nr:hypothetical protein SUGI_0831870 [Cryptomeria japonica]